MEKRSPIDKSWKEDYSAKYSLSRFAARVTRESLLEGAIPSICSICKLPVRELEIHHWANSQSWSIENGLYRRLCSSCNNVLGVIYGDKGYPSDWSVQFSALIGYLKSIHPPFDEKEGWWSMLTQKELAAVYKYYDLFGLLRVGSGNYYGRDS